MQQNLTAVDEFVAATAVLTTASLAYAGNLQAPQAPVHGGGQMTGTTGGCPGTAGGMVSGAPAPAGAHRICDRLKFSRPAEPHRKRMRSSGVPPWDGANDGTTRTTAGYSGGGPKGRTPRVADAHVVGRGGCGRCSLGTLYRHQDRPLLRGSSAWRGGHGGGVSGAGSQAESACRHQDGTRRSGPDHAGCGAVCSGSSSDGRTASSARRGGLRLRRARR